MIDYAVGRIIIIYLIISYIIIGVIIKCFDKNGEHNWCGIVCDNVVMIIMVCEYYGVPIYFY